MRKLMLLTAAGVGYVLGAKAGRTRYEQIRQGARKIARNPKVQSAAHHASETVQDAAPVVKDKVVAAAEKVRHHGEDAADDQGSGWPQETELSGQSTTSYPPVTH